MTPPPDDPVTRLVRTLRATGQLPSGPGVWVYEVAHDRTCALWTIGRCDCVPTIRATDATGMILHVRCGHCVHGYYTEAVMPLYPCPTCGDAVTRCCVWDTTTTALPWCRQGPA